MNRPTARPAALPAPQRRAQLTQARILTAAQELLTEGLPLSMEILAERAHVSVGAIYKRFQGKQSLLPLILEREQVASLARLREFVSPPRWQGLGLEARLEALFDAAAAAQQARRALIRGLVVDHLQGPPPTPDAQGQAMLEILQDWLMECRAEIRHPRPEQALVLGLHQALHGLQVAILFDRRPPGVDLATLRAELRRMLLAYLKS